MADELRGVSVGRSTRVPDPYRDVARLVVVQRRERLDRSPTDRRDHAFAQASVQVAHQLGVGLGQLTERAVQEVDPGRSRLIAGPRRGLEPEPAELGVERGEAAAGAGAGCLCPAFASPCPPDVGGIDCLRTDALGERREQTGEEGVRRRVEADTGRVRGEEVLVLGPAHGAAADDLDVDEPGLAEPFEMEAHGVRVESEAVGKVLRGLRRGGRAQLTVDGVAGLVAQRLEDGQLVHDTTVALRPRIFKGYPGLIPPGPTGAAPTGSDEQARRPMGLVPTNPDDPGAPIHEPVAGPPPTPEQVRQMLAGVIDPELRASIVELDMVGDIRVEDDGSVTIPVALTTAGCPMRGQIQRDVESKIRGLPGVRSVTVEYGEMTPEQKRLAMQRARFNAREHATPTAVPGTARVLAVASGKGGVGKSSVTVNLAVALAARGLTVGILDADIWGFSVPRMLGVVGGLAVADAKMQPNTRAVPGVDGAPDGTLEVVSMGFLVDDEGTALMWRGLMLTRALEHFLQDVRWGDLDYLLIDMPPGTGDIQMGLARLLPQAEMLVVTTPALAAQRVASRVADMARRSYVKIVGVVENMSTYVAPDGTRHDVFGAGGGHALAAEVGVPLVARVPLEPTISAGGDAGEPVAFAPPTAPRRRVPCAGGADRRGARPAGRDERLHGSDGGAGRRLACGRLSEDARLRHFPRRADTRAGDPAFGLELQQVRVHLAAGRVDQRLGQLEVAVQRRDDLADLGRPPVEHAEDLAFAFQPMREVLVDPGARLVDDVAVTGADAAEAQLAQPLEGREIDRHVAAVSRPITENMPSSTTSPVKRTRSSSRRKQRWLGACPGCGAPRARIPCPRSPPRRRWPGRARSQSRGRRASRMRALPPRSRRRAGRFPASGRDACG